MRIFTILFLFVAFSHANELKIKRFALIDPYSDRNTVAELCLELIPSPLKPTYIQITVDPDTRNTANYSTWIDSRGSVCTLISTLRGRVEVKLDNTIIHKSL